MGEEHVDCQDLACFSKSFIFLQRRPISITRLLCPGWLKWLEGVVLQIDRP